ncbi:Zn(2)-C6 fungal-type domain-containing protein [Mycena chlorophos]|uniref:Zn(2)-C6 fungal-type domain-containing protein n=1 Tax=Mycena chlorophos TaxID=658473 RepID=A0A8H6TKX7_MYCCL|nr:Zn(2)-C6 fungal-type domain-containing protein [Mycena chlorophos]
MALSLARSSSPDTCTPAMSTRPLEDRDYAPRLKPKPSTHTSSPRIKSEIDAQEMAMGGHTRMHSKPGPLPWATALTQIYPRPSSSSTSASGSGSSSRSHPSSPSAANPEFSYHYDGQYASAYDAYGPGSPRPAAAYQAHHHHYSHPTSPSLSGYWPGDDTGSSSFLNSSAYPHDGYLASQNPHYPAYPDTYDSAMGMGMSVYDAAPGYPHSPALPMSGFRSPNPAQYFGTGTAAHAPSPASSTGSNGSRRDQGAGHSAKIRQPLACFFCRQRKIACRRDQGEAMCKCANVADAASPTASSPRDPIAGYMRG